MTMNEMERLAAVARELRVPMLVDVHGATDLLRDGMQVTVDAEENVIYPGVVEEFIVGRELHYMAEAVVAGQTAGEGRFVRACERVMEESFGAGRVLLTAIKRIVRRTSFQWAPSGMTKRSLASALASSAAPP